MAYNGSGTYVREYNWVSDKNSNVKITASRFDGEHDSFATALTNALCKDGQSTPTANLTLGGFKITNLGDASADTDALNRQSGDARYLKQSTAVADLKALLDEAVHTITDVASATTCDIGAAATDRVRITGTTTITSFGTDADAIRFVHFDAALTLTHNATSLILPGGANIKTAAGDAAIFSSDASGNWRCLAYQRAGHDPLYPVSTVASATTTDIGAAASSRVSITGTTTITSFGTIPNSVRLVSFTGALTLTHNATSLILPGGVSITTAAGDCGIFSSDSSGNWRCLSYDKASGLPPAVATSAQFAANTSALTLTTDQAWGAAAEQTLSDSSSIAIDMSLGFNFAVTITANRTLSNPTNTKVGQSGFIRITQDGTGSRTLAYGSNWKFPGAAAPVLTTTANRTDYLFYTVRSSTEIVGNLLRDVR